MLTKLKTLIAPLLISIAPILLLAATNVGQFELEVIWLPIATSLVVATIAWVFWMIAFRNFEKAAILTSISMMIFLSHGHIHEAVVQTGAISRGTLHLVIFTTWIVLIALACFFLSRREKSLEPVTDAITTLAVILFVMGSVQLFMGVGASATEADQANIQQSVFPASMMNRNTAANNSSTFDLPDIYYVILDGYGRDDQLLKYYSFDNTEFIESLEGKGFYVAEKSHSNYSHTFLSLASSLNLRFVVPNAEFTGNQSYQRGPVYDSIQNHDLGRYLKAKGYKYIHLSTWWGPTSGSEIADIVTPWTLPEFQTVFLQTTMLQPLTTRVIPRLNNFFVPKGPELMLKQLATIQAVPQQKEPTFTFAHIICPHPPFYFDRNGPSDEGGDNYSWQAREPFVDQLMYLNKRIEGLVESIIEQSDSPPIIIIQADHGTASQTEEFEPSFVEERMSILNAYYVPDSVRENLYETITPVNSFRVLLNSLFDAGLPTLPDKINFSKETRPYDFLDATKMLAEDSGSKN